MRTARAARSRRAGGDDQPERYRWRGDHRKRADPEQHHPDRPGRRHRQPFRGDRDDDADAICVPSASSGAGASEHAVSRGKLTVRLTPLKGLSGRGFSICRLDPTSRQVEERRDRPPAVVSTTSS